MSLSDLASRPVGLSIALFILSLPFPAAGACRGGSPEDIRAAYSHWLAADAARDIDGTMAIFDKDVIFQFQGAPDAGWKELKASYLSDFAAPSDSKWAPTFDRIELSGDLAAAFATWTLTKSGKATQQNVSMDLFRRDAACDWHIVHSMNYPKK